MQRRVWTIVALAVFAACTSSNERSLSATRGDTSALQSESLGALLEADSVPFPGHSATVTRTGLVALSDGQDLQVAVFDSAGVRIETLGRKGQGPGEFQQIKRVFSVSPDTMAVVDNNTRAISFFVNGKFSHRSSWVEAWQLSSFDETELVGRFSDGRWVAFKTAPRSMTAGVRLVVDTPLFIVGSIDQPPHELLRLTPRRVIDLNIAHLLRRVQFQDLAGAVGSVCDSGIVIADTTSVRYYATDGRLTGSHPPPVARVKSWYKVSGTLASNELHDVRAGADRNKATELINSIAVAVDSSFRFGTPHIDVEGNVWAAVMTSPSLIYVRFGRTGTRDGAVAIPGTNVVVDQMGRSSFVATVWDTTSGERTWRTYSQPLPRVANRPTMGHCHPMFSF